MNPMNWISATGFRPCDAMPTLMPAISASASGVSITRRQPKRSFRPLVARNTPPLVPTSSPSTTTLGSFCMARASARFTASTSVTTWVAGSCSPDVCGRVLLLKTPLVPMMIASRQTRCFLFSPFPLCDQVRWCGVEQVVEQIVHRWQWQCLEILHALLYFDLAFGNQLLFFLFVPEPALVQECLQAFHRFLQPGSIDFLVIAVTGGVIGRGVIAQAIGDGFDQCRTFAGTGFFQRILHGVVNGAHIIAIHLETFDAGGHCFLGNGGSAGLQMTRHGNGPLIIVHHQHQRQLDRKSVV